MRRLVTKRQPEAVQRRDGASSGRASRSLPSRSREDAISSRVRGSEQRALPEKRVDAGRVELDARKGTTSSRARAGGIDRIREATRGRIGERRAESIARARSGKIDRTERVRIAGSEPRHRDSLRPRLHDHARRTGARVHRHHTPRHSHVVYRDRPDLVRHRQHHVHTYRDRYHRLTHRIIWPRYHYPVYYRWGPYVHYRWVHPYYHRKYVFVSLGGWWPWHYTYTRYYWYGWHPHIWYGYRPVPREVVVGSTNYYTYNYYTGENTTTSDSDVLPYGIDEETLAKVQERLAKQKAAEPAAQTQADVRFESGVKSFEAGQFAEAAAAFAEAMAMAPEDVILPFAYAQALFANNQYSESAEVLRAALKKVSPEEQGVFYPRGLYPDDDTLFEHIEDLLDKVEAYGFDADLQLLLGYHLLGVGETDYARAPLEQAAQDIKNAQAAKVLLELLDKMEEADTDATAAVAPAGPGGSTPVVVTPDVKVTPTLKRSRPSEAVKADVLKRAKAASASGNVPVEGRPGTPGAAPETKGAGAAPKVEPTAPNADEPGGAGTQVTSPDPPVNSQPTKKEDDENQTKQSGTPVPGGQ